VGEKGKVGGVRKERTKVRVRMGKSGAQRQDRGYRADHLLLHHHHILLHSGSSLTLGVKFRLRCSFPVDTPSVRNLGQRKATSRNGT
jgi:hypothetical protein